MTFKRLQIYQRMKNPYYNTRPSFVGRATEYSGYYTSGGRDRLHFLEINKPPSLLGFKVLTESRCSDLERSFESLSASFVSQDNRPASPTLKPNPFLNAKPFKFCRKETGVAEGEGLSGWEKKKYLQMYRSNNMENEERRSNVSFHEEESAGIERPEPKKTRNLQRGPTLAIDPDRERNSGIKKSKSLYLDILDFQRQENQTPSFYKNKDTNDKEASTLHKKYIEPIEEMTIEQEKEMNEIRRLNRMQSKRSGQFQQPSLITKINSLRDSKAKERPPSETRYQNNYQTNPYLSRDHQLYIQNVMREDYKPNPKPPNPKTSSRPSHPSQSFHSQPQPFPTDIPSTIFYKHRQFHLIPIREIPLY